MPYACKHPDHEKVEYGAYHSPAVPAQRNVDVLPEPGAQSHVPAPPELRHAYGYVGAVEVLRELKAHHPSKSYGHQRIAAEIEVQLEGIAGHGHPGHWNGYGRIAYGIGSSPDAPKLVGKYNLKAQAYHEGLETVQEFLQALLPLVKLRPDVRKAHYGARNKLREHHYVRAYVDEALLHQGRIPVDVDYVGDYLEGVEAYTYRKHQPEGCAEYEVYVFEYEQHPEVHHQSYYKDEALSRGAVLFGHPALVYHHAHIVVEHHGGQYDYQVERRAGHEGPVAVEAYAEKKHYCVPVGSGEPACQIICRKEEREKYA